RDAHKVKPLSRLQTPNSNRPRCRPQAQRKQRCSPSLPSYRLLAEHLLNPDLPTVTKILTDLEKRYHPEIHVLLSDYYVETANASLVCGLLLKDIDQIRRRYPPLKPTLRSFVSDSRSRYGLQAIGDFLADVSKTTDSFDTVASSQRKFRAVQEGSADLLKRLDLGHISDRPPGFDVHHRCLCSDARFGNLDGTTAVPVVSSRLASARRLARVVDQLDAAAKGTYILNRDLDTISRLVARLHDEAENTLTLLRLCERQDGHRRRLTQEVARQITKNLASFHQQLDELEEHLYLCFMTINRTRRLVLEELSVAVSSRLLCLCSSGEVALSELVSLFKFVVNMTDNVERVEGTSSRGADWEVVSLTASAYAAAPGPNEFNHNDESEEQEDITKLESSSALLMSGHFVFPPSEHENLPVVPDSSKNYSETEVHTPGAVSVDDGFDSLGKERQQTESNDDLHSFEFYDKESQTTTCEMVFEEGTGFQKLNLAGLEQGMLDDSESVAVHSETHKCDTEFEAEGSLDVIMDSPRGHTKLCEDEVDLPNLPCQVWWKRHATSLYCHAKESNTFWSVVVAAAVMGVVIMGRQWQRDKWQLHQIKWRFSICGEVCFRPL
ncbi:hypothetical protein B296_00043636, partial [Ensete ventricosum]